MYTSSNIRWVRAGRVSGFQITKVGELPAGTYSAGDSVEVIEFILEEGYNKINADCSITIFGNGDDIRTLLENASIRVQAAAYSVSAYNEFGDIKGGGSETKIDAVVSAPSSRLNEIKFKLYACLFSYNNPYKVIVEFDNSATINSPLLIVFQADGVKFT